MTTLKSLICAVILCYIVICGADVFKYPEYTDARLTWKIPQQKGAQLVTVVNPNGDNMFIIMGKEGYDSGGGYEGRWKFEGNAVTGCVDFILYNISKSDAGIYSTQIGSSKADGAELVVLYGPNEYPLIESSITESSTEKLTIRLICKLSGGNPPVKLAWTCRGEFVSSTNGSVNDTAMLEMDIVVDRSFLGQECICEATHPAWTRGRITSYKFNDTFLRHTIGRGTNMSLISLSSRTVAGEKLTFVCSYPTLSTLSSVNFTSKGPMDTEYDSDFSIQYNSSVCEAQEIRYTLPKTEFSCENSGTVMRWVIQSVPENWHQRKWKCTDNFHFYGSSEEKELYVIVPVENVTILPHSDIVEVIGTPVNLTCKSTPASRPEAFISWHKVTNGNTFDITKYAKSRTTKNDQDTSKQFTESTLTFIPEKADKYVYCVTENGDAASFQSEQRRLDITYGPAGLPFVFHNITGRFPEGISVGLTCELSGGNPLASLFWTCKGSFMKSVNTINDDLTVQKLAIIIDRTYDESTCVCTATHPLWPDGRSTKITFDVLYPPEGNISPIQRLPNKLYYLKEEAVTMICLSPSKSKPMPIITWQCNGVDRTSSAKITNEDNTAESEVTIVTDLPYENYTCSCEIHYSRTGYTQSAETTFVVVDAVKTKTTPNTASLILFGSSAFILIATLFIILIKGRKTIQGIRSANFHPAAENIELDAMHSYEGLGARDQPTESDYQEIGFLDSTSVRGIGGRQSYLEPVKRRQTNDNHIPQVASPYTGIDFTGNENRRGYENLDESDNLPPLPERHANQLPIGEPRCYIQ